MTGRVRIEPLSDDNMSLLKSFECADADLNDFLLNEASDYQKELLAVTYLVISVSTSEVIAYFSVLNDTIRLDENERNKWNKLNRKIPNNKRRRHYPAIKLGRLAVSRDYAHSGIGRTVIDYVTTACLNFRVSGCRFMTVDAYRDALGFYEKCGFTFFTDSDKDDETRVMYLDLKTLL